jgi:hypothetical protein
VSDVWEQLATSNWQLVKATAVHRGELPSQTRKRGAIREALVGELRDQKGRSKMETR